MNSFEPVICRTNAKSESLLPEQRRPTRACACAARGSPLIQAGRQPASAELHPAWPPSLPADPQIKHNGPRPDPPCASTRRPQATDPAPPALARTFTSCPPKQRFCTGHYRTASLRALATKAEEAERELRSRPIIGLFRMPTARSRQLIGLIYCLAPSSCSGSKGSRVFFRSPGLFSTSTLRLRRRSCGGKTTTPKDAQVMKAFTPAHNCTVHAGSCSLPGAAFLTSHRLLGDRKDVLCNY